MAADFDQRQEGTRLRRTGGQRPAQAATSRDAAALARDRAAEARDEAAANRDRALDAERDSRSPAAGGRAAEARKRAAADREQAARDRRHAAEYRAAAREEREALLRQVALSEADGLTGARARAPGLDDLRIEINRARRSEEELAVAYVDLVGLKLVNDRQGHSAGDSMLKGTVKVIRSHLRSYDVVVRVGGDEFVCIMPGATIAAARRRLTGIQADAAGVGIGIKFGVAALERGDDPSDLIERADAELLSGPRPVGAVVVDLASPRPADSGRPRILITDDRPETVVAVDSALAERYVCEYAGGLEEAEERLADEDFDLVLCDLHAGDGAVISFAARTIGDHQEIALLLVGAEEDPVVAEEAFELGVFGYVVRPLPGQLLITTMNALRRRDLEVSYRRFTQNGENSRQALIDMVPIAIYAKDAAGRYAIANATAAAVRRVEPEEMIGQTDHAFMSAEEAAGYASEDRRVLGSGTVFEREDTIEVDGAPKTYKTIRFPLRDASGEVVGVGGVAADITAEREAIRVRDESIEDLKLSRRETVEHLVRAIEHHDSSTGQHVKRLASLTALLGAGIGLAPDRVELLRHAAPMHDVGKIGTAAEVLRKRGPLTADERAVMEEHTLIGHDILADSKSELLRLAATIALTHHERYDGSGYPRGLSGEEIPIEGRITAVADVFDALLSERVYRPALPVEDVAAHLEAGRGTQFDPEIVELLLLQLDEALALRATTP
jgi:diguanylate cyclase (GGDEF)-like protein